MGHVPSSEYWGSQIPNFVNYGQQGHLTVRSVKLVADGALGSWGAALLEPYSDKPDDSGLLLTPAKELSALVHQFWKDGFQVVSKKDVPSSWMSYAETRVGPKRIKGAYAYQSLLRASPNHVLPLGSDFPVESIDPLRGFYAAVARLHVDPEHPDAPGTSPHGSRGWYSEQKLTREQALKGMTLDAAYASFMEKEIGSLTPGKKADFVVLNKDIMTIPVSDILTTKVTATVVDGKVVYGSL
ncbi:hypothetical protein C0993_002486 [Termitomyces sp. T159_Od127]|nr:hypothetical protein C0993_002486 [Termitomyces sp. T159_Od127]